MSFLWSSSLLLLGLIPLLVIFYIFLLRRRRRFTVRYSSLSLIREAASHQSRWKRHLPFALFLLAMTSLVFALGRPVATVTVPLNKATTILTVDVSISMCSNDIAPNRLEAAKNAAKQFFRTQVSNRQVGVVAFAGFAELIQPPTDNVQLLDSAVESLTPARRTAIGSAILRAIDAISEVDSRVPVSDLNGSNSGSAKPAGQFAPHIIVLLTDGASNAGPPPLSAAAQAAERGLRVYTIGFGTNNPSVMDCGNQFQENDFFGGGGGFGPGFGQGRGNGGGFNREIDDTTLRQIADMTGGKYYTAASAGELANAFKNLPTYVITTKQTTEITAFFTAFATLVAVLALFLSMRWNPLS
jgi:Ca-activated chloride channel family protein